MASPTIQLSQTSQGGLPGGGDISAEPRGMRRGVRGRGRQKSITEKALGVGPSPPRPALLPISVSAQRSPSHKGLPCPYGPRLSLSIPWPRARLSDFLTSPWSLSSSTSPTRDALVDGGLPAPSCLPLQTSAPGGRDSTCLLLHLHSCGAGTQ